MDKGHKPLCRSMSFMEYDKGLNIEKKEEDSHVASGNLRHGDMNGNVSHKPQKEAVIVDIEKAIGPRKSYPSTKNPSFDRFDKSLFDFEEEITPPHWAVPWSDIMMVVFVLFAVLFSNSLSKRAVADAFKMPNEMKKVEIPKQEVGYEMTPEKLDEMSRRLRQDTKPDQISIAVDKEQSIKVSASDSLFFDLGKADIKPEAIKFLRNFSEIVKKTNTHIRVEGHTDSFPIHSSSYPTNWELSAIRAVNITRFLIEENGIEPERFTVVGHSSYKPAAPYDTITDKAKNRRVEIYISK
jgi:chemotaxis protein MotB